MSAGIVDLAAYRAAAKVCPISLSEAAFFGVGRLRVARQYLAATRQSRRLAGALILIDLTIKEFERAGVSYP